MEGIVELDRSLPYRFFQDGAGSGFAPEAFRDEIDRRFDRYALLHQEIQDPTLDPLASVGLEVGVRLDAVDRFQEGEPRFLTGVLPLGRAAAVREGSFDRKVLVLGKEFALGFLVLLVAGADPDEHFLLQGEPLGLAGAAEVAAGSVLGNAPIASKALRLCETGRRQSLLETVAQELLLLFDGQGSQGAALVDALALPFEAQFVQGANQMVLPFRMGDHPVESAAKPSDLHPGGGREAW